jgi:hypothetical protein
VFDSPQTCWEDLTNREFAGGKKTDGGREERERVEQSVLTVVLAVVAVNTFVRCSDCGFVCRWWGKKAESLFLLMLLGVEIHEIATRLSWERC